MTVFLACSDETVADTGSMREFYYAGFIAPLLHWHASFALEWQAKVLDGPPQIPYLHMTDVMRKEWCENHGLSRRDAEGRIDSAISVIEASNQLLAFSVHVNVNAYERVLPDYRIASARAPQYHGGYRPEPDLLCFLIYAFHILKYISDHYSDVEKVDFLVEQSNRVTRHIQELYPTIGVVFPETEYPELAQKMGDLIPVTKERILTQPADVWCWHLQRAKCNRLNTTSLRRFNRIAERSLYDHEITEKQLRKFLHLL